MNITIVGAGALGRGLIYPIANEAGHDVYLVDIDRRLYGRVVEWEATWVGDGTSYSNRYASSVDRVILRPPDLVFTCVPPSAIVAAADILRAVTSVVPIVCLENIKDSAALYRKHLPGHNLINGIAWVSAFGEGDAITAYESQNRPFKLDRISADAGIVEIEKEIPLVHQRLSVVDDYETRYEMKTMLHNAPHALIAYLGWHSGERTIPEAFDRYRDALDRVFDSLKFLYPSMGVQIYREYKRFSTTRFPDLVERVARCPSRKLMRGERLPRLYHAFKHNPPQQSLVSDAIDYAIDYGEKHDPMVSLWIQQNGRESFLEHFCGISE